MQKKSFYWMMAAILICGLNTRKNEKITTSITYITIGSG